MKGRKPKPVALKLIQGRAREQIKGSEPKPSTDLPDRPAIIKGAARREWDRLVPQLREAGLLTRVDGVVLAAFCQTYARWLEAEKAAESEPQIVERANGSPMISPRISLIGRLLDTMLRLSAELGMTPSSRTRITVTPPLEPDALESFLLDRK